MRRRGLPLWGLLFGAMALAGACGGDAEVGTGADTADAGADAVTDTSGEGDSAPGDDAEPSGDVAEGDTATADLPPAPECPEPTGERPARRSEHAGIYDPVGDQIVIFGGSFAVPQNCGVPTPTFEDETWIYDVACDAWRLVPGPGPQGRVRHMAAFDSARRRMVVFGGRWREGSSGNYTLMGDVWALDLASETWSEVATTSGPAPRVNGALVYDPAGDRLVLFGGNTAASGAFFAPKKDVWTLDLATGTWKELTATGGPTPRLWQAGIWDPTRSRLVVHGGADETAFDNTAKYFSDLWALTLTGDEATWQRLDDPDAYRPAGRFWGGLVYDAEGDRYVLFGGHDDGNLGNRNDLQAFDPAAGAWTLLRPGDTWKKPATGLCAFPPDFTNIDMESPERRNAHVFVGGQAGRAFIVGGKTDCGVVDDLVALELEAGTWTELTGATVGVSCLRRGGQTCNDLCF